MALDPSLEDCRDESRLVSAGASLEGTMTDQGKDCYLIPWIVAFAILVGTVQFVLVLYFRYTEVFK